MKIPAMMLMRMMITMKTMMVMTTFTFPFGFQSWIVNELCTFLSLSIVLMYHIIKQYLS